MPIRNASDYRSVIWVATACLLLIAQYCNPNWVIFLSPLSCYVAIACGTIAHNHNHRATFSSRRWNNWFGHILSVFYGYPTMMWVPTHNLNHHHFVNRPGDATATWRYCNKHNWRNALSYPFVSGYFQSFPIKEYIAKIKVKKPGLYATIRFQYMFWLGSYVLMGFLAGYLYRSQQTGLGIYVWFFSMILPAICSSVTIMFFNYIQHVHTDAFSDHDHSRNFTGKWFNFLFFNNGFHTVHHDYPGLHWSELPAAHAKVSETIAPQLNQKNVIVFLIRQYLVAPLFPSVGTRQIGTVANKVTIPEAKPEVSSPHFHSHEHIETKAEKVAEIAD